MTDYSVLAASFNPPRPAEQVEPRLKQGPKPKAPRKPLPARSPKRIAEGPLRKAFVQAVIEKAGYRCQGPELGLPEMCRSYTSERPALDVHEPDQRSTHPGSHVRSTLAVALCHHHHSMCTDPVGETRVLVESLGLIVRATS